MRLIFALVVLSFLAIPVGCGSSDEQGTAPEPDISTPEALEDALPMEPKDPSES